MSEVDFAGVDRAIRDMVDGQGFMQLVGARIDRMAPGEAKVVKPGGMLTIVEAKVYSHENGEPRLASIALATIAMIDRPPAAA